MHSWLVQVLQFQINPSFLGSLNLSPKKHPLCKAVLVLKWKCILSHQFSANRLELSIARREGSCLLQFLPYSSSHFIPACTREHFGIQGYLSCFFSPFTKAVLCLTCTFFPSEPFSSVGSLSWPAAKQQGELHEKALITDRLSYNFFLVFKMQMDVIRKVFTSNVRGLSTWLRLVLNTHIKLFILKRTLQAPALKTPPQGRCPSFVVCVITRRDTCQ